MGNILHFIFIFLIEIQLLKVFNFFNDKNVDAQFQITRNLIRTGKLNLKICLQISFMYN